MGTICLLSLGSNLGDREATLHAALAAIAAAPQVKLLRTSGFLRSEPVGGPATQGEFLNAAAVLETELEPAVLLAQLGSIEDRFGRQRRERWAARTLDLDLLLYGDAVIDSGALVVPHPRMSFRRFVLEPSAEIAGEMVHPTIGWPLSRLREHLDAPGDRLVLLSPSEAMRQELADVLIRRCDAKRDSPAALPEASRLWPPSLATWLRIGPGHESPSPKLTVVLDPPEADSGKTVDPLPTELHQPGRGPTLTLTTTDPTEIETEVRTAVQAVWPDLCR